VLEVRLLLPEPEHNVELTIQEQCYPTIRFRGADCTYECKCGWKETTSDARLTSLLYALHWGTDMSQMNAYQAAYVHGMLRSARFLVTQVGEYLKEHGATPLILKSVDSIHEGLLIMDRVVTNLKEDKP
jgi:hypothetical protein